MALRSLSPFCAAGDADRLRDFPSQPASLDLLRESRCDLALERLFERDLERDLRSAERERDFWERERDFDLRDPERDLRGGDFLSPEFLPDLERERLRPLLLRERDLEGKTIFKSSLPVLRLARSLKSKHGRWRARGCRTVQIH